MRAGEQRNGIIDGYRRRRIRCLPVDSKCQCICRIAVEQQQLAIPATSDQIRRTVRPDNATSAWTGGLKRRFNRMRTNCWLCSQDVTSNQLLWLRRSSVNEFLFAALSLIPWNERNVIVLQRSQHVVVYQTGNVCIIIHQKSIKVMIQACSLHCTRALCVQSTSVPI